MIRHELAVACQNCQVDHTGLVIVLGFAAFFAVITVVMELIEVWRNKR